MRLVLAAVVLGTSLLATPSPAGQIDDDDVRAEYKIKAAFLYNFGRYVEWPLDVFTGPTDTFVIGILGNSPLGGVLEEVAAKKTIAGRKIVIRTFASLADYRPLCHILFISSALSPEQQASALKQVQGVGVLSIGETLGFADRGGVINFLIDDGRVRFEINVEAAKRSQLHMDAKLLSLGKRAQDGRPAASAKAPSSTVSRTDSPP